MSAWISAQQPRLRTLLVILAACLLFCLIFALDLIPGLRGDFGWRWPYEIPNWPRLLPAVVVVFVYIAAANRIKHPAVVMLWGFMGAVAIPIACLYLLDDPFYLLVTRTLSGLATGTHMAGTEIRNATQTARDWPQIMPTFLQEGKHSMMSVHVALSPPGLPLFYHALNRLLEAVPALADPLGMALRSQQCHNYAIMAYSNAQLASAWVGVLMPVWAALTVLPLYFAGGRLAALWWPLVPSLALFTASWNIVYPLLAICAYLLLSHGLRPYLTFQPQAVERENCGADTGTRRLLLIIGSGVLVSLATFANISTFPLIGFLGIYTALVFFKRWNTHRETIKTIGASLLIGALFLMGLSSVWVVYYIVSGVTPLAILNQALGQHLTLDRPYLPWIYLHLYDLALFTGLPVVLLALAAIVRGLPLRRRFDVAALDPLGVALALTLIVLALSGTARGETGRVWMFFVPFILILAAKFTSPPHSPSLRSGEGEVEATGSPAPNSKERAGGKVKLLITITQAVFLLTLVAFLRTVGTELTPPPTQPKGEQASVDPLPVPATFAGSFVLVGWRGTPDKDGIDLTLSWRADRRASVPYYLSALIVDPDGNAISPANNWQPFDTRYPITCWSPDQVITETRHLPISGRTAKSGDYWISLSAFETRDGAEPKSVIVSQPGQPLANQIGLGPVRVP
jgi:hypothetical protein